MNLIDKDALVAWAKETYLCENASMIRKVCYKQLLEHLNTLEIKEVDLEKHLKEDIEDVFFDLNGVAVKGATHYLTVEDVKDIAKHFFELGMSVNNPITAADRGTAEEIIINLKRVEKDYRIDLTREIEWLRNKVKKGD